jgi:hypothetical protein
MIERWGEAAGERPGFLTGLIETATVVNAALMAASVRTTLSAHGREDVQAVCGVYDLESRRVGVSSASGKPFRLLDPPAGAEGFRQLGLDVAAGPAVARAMEG